MCKGLERDDVIEGMCFNRWIIERDFRFFQKSNVEPQEQSLRSQQSPPLRSIQL